MIIIPRDLYYANDYRIQIALYVSLRSATNQETQVLDHAQQEARTLDGHPRQFKGITWKMCTRRARCSYLRIDVSLNTLFIFVRYIPRRWNPPRGEVRSTGNYERAPAVMIYRGTLRRACARASGGVHAHASAAVAIVPARLVNRHVGGYLLRIRSLLHFFLFPFFTSTREKLVWRQCRPGITRVSDLKGHPSSWMYAYPRSV